jgi:hypothetical protein
VPSTIRVSELVEPEIDPVVALLLVKTMLTPGPDLAALIVVRSNRSPASESLFTVICACTCQLPASAIAAEIAGSTTVGSKDASAGTPSRTPEEAEGPDVVVAVEPGTGVATDSGSPSPPHAAAASTNVAAATTKRGIFKSMPYL